MNEIEKSVTQIDEAKLNVIAAEIRVIQEHARSTVLSAACEIGKRLLEVKCGLPHGRFTQWLKENVECSERQAQQMMALYEEYGKNGNPQTYAGLSVSQAVALLAAPEDVRTELIESGAAWEMSVRALKEEIARQKAEIESRQMKIEELEANVVSESMRAEQAEKERGRAKAAAETAEANRQKAAKQRDEAKKQAEDAEKRREALEAEKGELEKQLSEAQAVEKVVEIEVTPQEVLDELGELRRKLREAPDKSVILAREAYARGVREFESLRELVMQMDAKSAGDYTRAFAKGIRMIADKLENL